MDIEQKWNIPEELLRKAFEHLSIEEELYSLFKARANRCVNELAKQFKPESPDKEDFNSSIETATTYIQEFERQVLIGHSELWSDKYACNIDPDNEVNNVQNAYDAVKLQFGENIAEKELALYANSLCEDPIFVEAYIYYFHNVFEDPEITAKEYTDMYKSLIEKGKSAIYAKEYTLHFINDYLEEDCENYASKFEECITNGRDEDTSRRIAYAYEDQCRANRPKNVIKAYMDGFEYAIDNSIKSPYDFAEEYMKTFCFSGGKKPSFVAKGEYDDIICKLLANKG